MRIVWLMPLFLLVAACTPGEEPDTDDINLDEVIVFPDPKMESFIRLRAHLDADEPITVRKVKNLIYLECISCGITDLTGLEKMPWVKELELPGNPITGLEPLRTLIDLEYLNIGRGGYHLWLL